MLHLSALHLRNFGPFKGEQVIRFPDEDGVSIFYGDNMRGKTTLLNAIRFAFFGRVIGRSRRAVSLHDIGNWESASEGVFGFEVRLELTHASAAYRLTRTCSPRSAVISPSSNEDYKVEYYLERGGHILGPQQAAIELERILPEQISRFFLFDGELLQEYEDLLHGDSDMGPKISGAIERILGIPVLTAARDSMKAAADRAEQREAVAAQGDQKTREFGNQLASLVEERRVLTEDQARQERELEDLRSRKAATEEDMRKQERLTSLIEKRDRLEVEISNLKGSIELQRSVIETSMTGAWATLLKRQMTSAAQKLRRRERDLQTSVTQANVLQSLTEGHDPSCPTCLQVVGHAAQAAIKAAVKLRSSGVTSSSEQQELSAVRRQLDALEAQIAISNPEALKLLWSTLARTERAMYTTQGEADELTRQLRDTDDEALRGLRRDYDSIVRQIQVLETGILATIEVLVEKTSQRDGIQRRLDKLSGGKLDTERSRRQLAGDLLNLFTQGVKVYREQLRHRVEADASRHFKALTTEPDYKGLRINDNYGLTIIHNDGAEIPIRSAGAEHVVALSLVAALQNNAPLRGPIIIDSPFGRLDGGHRARIVEALPEMADQIVLLVYEEEMPPAKARSALKGRLKAEWTLERSSAKHTEIVPR